MNLTALCILDTQLSHKFSICPIFILFQLNCDVVSEKEFVTETNATLLYLSNNLILKKISRN